MSGSEEYLDDYLYDKFDVLDLLGKGAYGVVWKVVDKETQDVIALKKIFKAFQNRTDAQRTFREIVLLNSLKHSNIITLHGVMKAENDEDIYLLFDDLHYAIRAGILHDDHKRYIIYQLLKALLFIHSANVIHRDIKPENLLLNTACVLKVADFGLARSVSEGKEENNTVMTDYVATRWYRAPEILLGSTEYTKGVDMWSVGCIVAELYGEKPLFPGKSTMDQLGRVCEITGKPTQEQLDDIGSKYASHMLDSLKRVMPRSLASMYSECSDDTIDFMEKLLKFSPNERIGINEALEHDYVKAFRESDEVVCQSEVVIPIDDNDKRPVEVYREALYQFAEKNKPVETDQASDDTDLTSRRSRRSGRGERGERRKSRQHKKEKEKRRSKHKSKRDKEKRKSKHKSKKKEKA